MKPKLTEAGFQSAATALGVEVASIKAVCEVEAPKGGFLDDNRVTILFERHKFHKFTAGAYDASAPDISNSKAGGYGAAGAHQYVRFSKAFNLDPKAAMKSCSWGKFQIMGYNFASAGFSTLDLFITAMKESEDAQLLAFVNIVKSFSLVDELKSHDWAGFARGYNGANYKINHYDVKLANAYRKYSQTPKTGEVTGNSIIGDLPAVDEDDQDETPEPVTPILAPKLPEPEKGVTTTEPTSGSSGTPPPAPAVEVLASQPSLFTRLGSLSIPAGVMTVLAGIGKFVQTLPPWAWVAIIGTAIIVGYLIWRDSKQQAHERTLHVMDAAADQTKNNLRLV